MFLKKHSLFKKLNYTLVTKIIWFPFFIYIIVFLIQNCSNMKSHNYKINYEFPWIYIFRISWRGKIVFDPWQILKNKTLWLKSRLLFFVSFEMTDWLRSLTFSMMMAMMIMPVGKTTRENLKPNCYCGQLDPFCMENLTSSNNKSLV